MSPPRIVLASTSRYRAELLRRIIPEFELAPPVTTETVLPGEAPRTRAVRLAAAKAESLATGMRNALVIGSDQVAALDGTLLHKPGNVKTAHEQLRASSGNSVDFFTALSVIDARNGRHEQALDHTRVVFRELDDDEIERYLARERPLDCAGSVKVEGAGIALFERIDTTDPTALVGLPLIALAGLLRRAGIPVP